MPDRLMNRVRSQLVLVDYQSRLMPAIHEAETVVKNGRRLGEAARLLAVPILVTEQNSKGLGHTVPELGIEGYPVIEKQTFGSCATPAFLEAIDNEHDLIVAGCEAQVCVLQTVLGLIERNRRVYVVRDATGSRQMESKEAALARMQRAGAEIVTTEMVVFEWLRTSDHPTFRSIVNLIK